MWMLIALLVLFPIVSPAYERIISLSPQVTESVYLLNGESRLIAISGFCKQPDNAAKKERIGTPLRPDIERIVSLKPDLVLGSREGNSPFTMERLKNLGIKVHYFSRPKDFNGLAENFLQLSSMLEKKEQGKMIIDTVEASMKATGYSTPFTALWQVGADPLIVASSSSLANDIIHFAGGVNIIKTELPYPRMNVEEVVLQRPEVIVLTSMGYSVETEKGRWRRFLKDARFVTLDPYVVGSPTPVSFLKAVKRLRAALHRPVDNDS
ncbi:MAG TPA: helical backbone metal receptor [Syntrophorhabdaceae bacterium]|nr:helical backbone metal receptor [Syntrophorhabdaceae bacterium]